MRIEAYFAQIRARIAESPVVITTEITSSNQGEGVGYMRANITFVDGSMLHFREYIDAEYGIERLMYSYHYMDRSQRLVFRYDNADHHRELNLANYPHHKHADAEKSIITSSAPSFFDVINEIEYSIQFI